MHPSCLKSPRRDPRREGITLHNHTLFLFLCLLLLVLSLPLPPSLPVLRSLSPPLRAAFLFSFFICPLCPLVLLILELQGKRVTGPSESIKKHDVMARRRTLQDRLFLLRVSNPPSLRRRAWHAQMHCRRIRPHPGRRLRGAPRLHLARAGTPGPSRGCTASRHAGTAPPDASCGRVRTARAVVVWVQR